MRSQHRKYSIGLLLTAAVFLPLVAAAPEKSPLPPADPNAVIATPEEQQKALKLAAEDHVALLTMLLERHDRTVRDYTGIFHKQEKIGGRLTPGQKIAFRFRPQPFSVCMEWLENPVGADRLLYVEGRHGGKMLAHPTGLMSWMKAVKLDPEGKQALKSTLRPVTMFGFRNSLVQTIKVYREAAEKGHLQTAFSGPETIEGRKYFTIERFLPKDKYENPQLTIRIDMEYLLPTQITTADAQGDLQSHYAWTDLKFNTNLTEGDFTPKACNLE
ncbi:MAG TPA: DUF1571 domain-containing protein [Anaerohalosphaeraceae bacterium]|nr:DUF1571 domain-containing protein [Anaerohalosphaeraceae bacterium]HRT50358.1 DUF1571 domain-containing protein [Anaerohalosphaeraceae bacterium]HRT86289.1 DUF1571 domain-containing protein [Anaerohalosphaeraceae bacterium]